MRRKQVEERVHAFGNKAYDEAKMKDYFSSKFDGNRSSILIPAMGVRDSEIKSQLIQMLQNASTFGGSPTKDPNSHLDALLEICSIINIHQVPDEVVCLRLFNFSLRVKAKSWLTSLPPNSNASLEDHVQKFSSKYFPHAKANKLRNEISTFTKVILRAIV